MRPCFHDCECFIWIVLAKLRVFIDLGEGGRVRGREREREGARERAGQGEGVYFYTVW